MVDPGIGRLLISSLHQGIADISPARLDFYEAWLSPAGMRDGRIGLAPLGAVLSFIHREEPPASAEIASRAGTCAADWTFQEVSSLRRWCTRRLPAGLRVRAVLGLGKKLVVATVRRSTFKARIRGGTVVIEIRSALFDQLRAPASLPMRGFYAAALRRLFEHCGIDAQVEVADGLDAGWSLAVTVRGPRGLEAVDVT